MSFASSYVFDKMFFYFLHFAWFRCPVGACDIILASKQMAGLSKNLRCEAARP